ncbi:uncharacterized protein [Battus philenor]|uniref:uncharacterized protein n=1 Tax=Battus philenor TaxID=42288 RepID=UPI0035CF1525
MIPRVEDISEDVNEKKLESELNYEYENIRHVKWYDQLLLNRPLKVLLAILITSIALPLLIYQFLFFPSADSPPADGYSTGSCLLRRAVRLPCGVGTMNNTECHPQCCYDPDNSFCFHRLPSRFSYILDREWSENVTLQPRISTVPFSSQNSIVSLKISIDELTPTHLSINFYNPQYATLSRKKIDQKYYKYEISSPEMNVVVNSSSGNIFNTIRGPLIASQNIWEIAFRITNESMFGLGEIPLNPGTVKVLYNHDKGLSSVPLIFGKLNDSFHGLLIDSSTPTEVTIRGENQIVVRSITSFGLKFHLFTGPKPEDVMKQVMKYIGSFEKFEYWMFGAHICSVLSENLANTFTEFNDFMTKATRQRLPYESQCGPIPIVFKTDQCDPAENDIINRGLRLIRRNNKRYVPHVSPYLRHVVNETTEETEVNNGTKRSCASILSNFERHVIRNSKNLELYIGSVGNDTVLYLDYNSISSDLMKKLWDYTVDVDGLILENNWPLDETEKLHNEVYLFLPYFNKNFEIALDRTLQWNVSLPNDGGKHFYKHNLYGNNFIEAAQRIFEKELPTWSTSQWMNGNIIVNRQNVDTSWTSFHKELIAMALGGVSGHWFWSTPVCGDSEHFEMNRHSQLCLKWYMAATFFPVLTVNSKIVQRDPIQFEGTYRSYINNALNQRLSLLSYFFTTLQNGPLLRPMFYQYPGVAELENLNTQFNVGDNILIIPNLQPSQTHVHIWMPPGTWYELWSGLKLNATVGEAITMTSTDSDFLALIRGGSIVPLQKDVRLSAEQTRRDSNFALIVALECTNGTSNTTGCNASGHIYMTSNITINLQADTENLYITAKGDGYEALCDSRAAIWARRIQEINIYGLDEELNNFDNHKQILTSIDLCQLEEMSEIHFKFA